MKNCLFFLFSYIEVIEVILQVNLQIYQGNGLCIHEKALIKCFATWERKFLLFLVMSVWNMSTVLSYIRSWNLMTVFLNDVYCGYTLLSIVTKRKYHLGLNHVEYQSSKFSFIIKQCRVGEWMKILKCSSMSFEFHYTKTFFLSFPFHLPIILIL